MLPHRGRRLRVLPYKFRDIRRRFGSRPFALLDVGCGNHSATLAKAWFPSCTYAGVDREQSYNNDADDLAAMDAFYEIDLTSLKFGAIPDGSFDVILMAHVIEHLVNGDEVTRALVPKMRPGGLIYIEFPGRRSLSLPSWRDTLNFYDDPTHVRLFTAGEVRALLESLGLRVLRAGVRRDPLGILLLPVHAWNAKRFCGYVPGGVFWDLLGFADVVVAVRELGGQGPATPAARGR